MKSYTKYIIGFLLIFVGLILGLNAFGITNINIFFDGWWTLFIIIPSLIGLINDSVWFPIYFILTGGTIFITTILATDFYSPATKKGKIFYGIFIGITLTILRFISPYNVAPFSIFLANTFSFAFDYLSAFIERKKI